MTELLRTPLIIPSPWRCNNISTTKTITPIIQRQRQRQRRGCVLITKTVDAAVVSSNLTIRSMANPKRVKMVAKQIRRELSEMLLTDNVLQFAVLPEASLGADCFLSSVTTITDVEVTADLQVVRVYVSVFGDERGKEIAIAGLKSKAKYVRSELGRRMKLRLTPEIRFFEDESFERGSRVIALLDKIKNEKSPGTQNIKQLDSSVNEDDTDQLDSSANEDDTDWDGEDPEEGIIYVE